MRTANRYILQLRHPEHKINYEFSFMFKPTVQEAIDYIKTRSISGNKSDEELLDYHRCISCLYELEKANMPLTFHSKWTQMSYPGDITSPKAIIKTSTGTIAVKE